MNLFLHLFMLYHFLMQKSDGYFDDTLFLDTDFSNADLGGTIFASELITLGNRTCINHEFCD